MTKTEQLLYDALKELLTFGVELDDARLSYVVAQVDRGAIEDAQAAILIAEQK